jgi:phosphohistidine phosphatase SixA
LARQLGHLITMTTVTERDGHDPESAWAPPSSFRVLLRHADAGIRGESAEPDAWRALSPLGWRQATAVIGRLDGLSVVRVFASPALRCRQTVVPLARSLSADVEPRAELAIDADPGRLMAFLRSAETESAVLCTHRETLDRLFALVALTGGQNRPVDGSAPMAKAALWAIGVGGQAGLPEIRYLSPGFPRV